MAHGGDIYRNKVHTDFSVNLNPMGTPEEVSKALEGALLRSGCYPDPEQEAVRSVMAEKLGISSENVIAANGASALLMAAVRAIMPKHALLFEPCFSGYHHALLAPGCQITTCTTKEEAGFTFTEEDTTVLHEGVDVVFVCDPASPSGKNAEEGVLEKLLSKAKAIGATVILDESFYPLSDACIRNAGKGAAKEDRAMRLLGNYENLIIIRSLTKTLALPGIRIGYALGSKDEIRRIKDQLPQWDLSVMGEEAIQAGMRVLYESDYLEASRAMIQRERTYLADSLRSLGFFVYESNAPYLLFKASEDLYQKLLEQGILIRDCRDYEGLGAGYFRIAVKIHEENEKLIQTIRGMIDAF